MANKIGGAFWLGLIGGLPTGNWLAEADFVEVEEVVLQPAVAAPFVVHPFRPRLPKDGVALADLRADEQRDAEQAHKHDMWANCEASQLLFLVATPSCCSDN